MASVNIFLVWSSFYARQLVVLKLQETFTVSSEKDSSFRIRKFSPKIRKQSSRPKVFANDRIIQHGL